MRKKLIACLLVTAGLVSLFNPLTLEIGHAQSGDGTRFEHLTTADGLSSNAISSIAQDAQGYMWFATGDAGLNRYDGYQVTIYRNDPQDPASLSGDRLQAVFCDSQGLLWVGGGAGLDRYDRQQDTFVQYLHDDNDPASISSR
jgi:ligand-binding sensor domain-containing protein